MFLNFTSKTSEKSKQNTLTKTNKTSKQTFLVFITAKSSTLNCQITLQMSYSYFFIDYSCFELQWKSCKKQYELLFLIVVIAAVDCAQSLTVIQIRIQPFGCNLAVVGLYLFAVYFFSSPALTSDIFAAP